VPERDVGPKPEKTYYEQVLEAKPDADDYLYPFLVAMRRAMLGEEPGDRELRAVAVFDETCARLGVPFLKP